MTTEAVQPTAENPEVQEKKKFELLNVIIDKVTGTVKWFSVRRHYGFIQRNDNKEDVFVHRTAITGTKMRYPSLKNGETVEFSVVETTGGVNAAAVTGPDGQDVKGVRFYRRPKPPTHNEGGEGHDAPVNGEGAQAGGDVEGSRPRGGPRRLRRPRRPNQPSQNGMGDGETAGEASGEGAVAATSEGGVNGGGGLPRQRPQRFRGGRGRPGGGGGNRLRQHSGTKEQQNDGEAEGVEGEGATSTTPADGEASWGPRRGGGRFRRGGRNRRNGPPRQASGGDNNAVEGSNESALEKKMEAMSLDSKGSEDQQQPPEPAPEQSLATEPPKQESANGEAN